MTGKKQKKSYSSMTSDRNSWNCLSSEGAICEQCLALRCCGTCKLQYLEAHFKKKWTIYIIYVYILSISSRGKAIAFLACKVPGCNNAWRAKLYHVENQLVANHAILHLWLSPEVFFNNSVRFFYHTIRISEIENIEQHDGHDQNKGLLSYRHPTTRLWSLILAAPIPHLLWYKSAMLPLDISWNPYSMIQSR